MACCGDRRRSLTQSPPGPAPATPRVARPASVTIRQPQASQSASAGSVLVRYVGGSKTVVMGAVTRRYYAFSTGAAVQSVDARDAAPLLRSVSFRRA